LRDQPAADEAFARALTIATQRRSEPSIRRLAQFCNALEPPRFQTAALALDLRDQIRTATTASAALPAGNTS